MIFSFLTFKRNTLLKQSVEIQYIQDIGELLCFKLEMAAWGSAVTMASSINLIRFLPFEN